MSTLPNTWRLGEPPPRLPDDSPEEEDRHRRARGEDLYDDEQAQMDWYERTGQIDAAYRKQDPRTWKPLKLIVDGQVVREQPPRWFIKKARAARRPQVVRPAPARPRARTSHRTSSPTRGSPDDDADGDPEGQPRRRKRGAL